MRVLYGINPVAEALASEPGDIKKILVADTRTGRGAREIVDRAGRLGVAVERVPARELEKAAGTAKHQGVAAVLSGGFRYRTVEDLVEAWKESGERAFFLILDSIQDPQNLGSLVRAAHAAGVHGIVVPKDRAAEVTPTVVKASAGATEHMLIARETNIVRAITVLKDHGVWTAAVEAGEGESVFEADLAGDMAVVIGSEGQGIRRLVKKNCDFSVYIPMAREFNSLNAAQAGAITLFEMVRQRRAKAR